MRIDIKHAFGQLKLKAKENSPEILLAAGLIAGVTSTVLACKQTLKLEGVLEEGKKELEDIRASKDEEHDESTTDNKKAVAMAYAKTGKNLLKLYFPPMLVGVTSAGCIIASNRILEQRVGYYSAALATVSASYATYREKVIDKYGEETDFELRHDVVSKKEKVEEVDENGKKKTKTKNIKDIQGLGDFAFFVRPEEVDASLAQRPEDLGLVVKRCQDKMNIKLRTFGYVFLADVYNDLGMAPPEEAMLVGWLSDPECPDAVRVDLGFEKNASLIEGSSLTGTNTYILDPNVSGPIYTKYWKHHEQMCRDDLGYFRTPR